MTALFRNFLLLTTPFIMSACLTMPDALSFGETKEFDGTWSGRLMLSIGEASCARRTPITVSVENGGMQGKTNFKNFNAKIRGYIQEDGTITGGKVEVDNDFYNYEIDGKFEGELANGTWKSNSCAGKWDLRRVRKTVS